MKVDDATTPTGDGADLAGEQAHPASGPRARFPRGMPLSLRSIALLVLALGLVVGSIALSQNSVTSNNPKFIQLWMLPQPIAAGANAGAAQVGVQNTQTSDVDLIVRITEGSHVILSKSLPHLAPGDSWTQSVERSASEKLVATVSYASQPTKVVRHVYLQSPAN
jgi:hypothetical protein